MNTTIWQRLDGIARAACPFTITLLLIIVALIPLHIPDLAPIVPSVLLVSAFYWTLYRPELMPVWAVFGLAVIQDLLTGAILGIGPLIYLLFCLALNGQRRFLASASFAVLWCSFAVMAGLALALQWLLNYVVGPGALDYRPVLFQGLMTIAIYPLLTWLFAATQRYLLRN